MDELLDAIVIIIGRRGRNIWVGGGCLSPPPSDKDDDKDNDGDEKDEDDNNGLRW